MLHKQKVQVYLSRTPDDVRLVVEVPVRGASVEVSTRAGVSLDSFTQLLGLILAQAWIDGMIAVSLGWIEAAKRPILRYHGRDAAGLECSWEVVAPPAEAYAPLVRAILEATVMDAGVEPQGTLRAVINGKTIEARVKFDSWYEVEVRRQEPL